MSESPKLQVTRSKTASGCQRATSATRLADAERARLSALGQLDQPRRDVQTGHLRAPGRKFTTQPAVPAGDVEDAQPGRRAGQLSNAVQTGSAAELNSAA